MYSLGKFPHLSDISCKSKWSWSTIIFYNGLTSSCHRVDKEKLTPSSMMNFHNTDEKMKQRQSMLDNKWPMKGCEFCKNVEDSGGISDRIHQSNIPSFPMELENGTITTATTPTTVEVYLDNKCNLACVYCHTSYSSRIASENKKFGKFPNIDLRNEFQERDPNIDENKKIFWEWMVVNSHNVEHFNVLGGEPFIQYDFNVCVDFFKNNPRPNLTLTFVSNLMLPSAMFVKYINLLKILVDDGCVKRIDITASIDSWGDDQEYTRHGIDLKKFEKNMDYLLTCGDWLYLTVNHTVSSLSIVNFHLLMDKVSEWRVRKPIYQTGGFVTHEPHLHPLIFPNGFWDRHFESALKKINSENGYEEKNGYDVVNGMYIYVKKMGAVDEEQIGILIRALNEYDRRR